MPRSRQLPAGILTAVNFKEVRTHEIWWWSSGDLLDVSADPLIVPYTHGISRRQPSTVNDLMGKEGRGDFFFFCQFRRGYHISQRLTGWAAVSFSSPARKKKTSSLVWFAKTLRDSKLRRKYRQHSAKVQGWDILRETANVLLLPFWLKRGPKHPSSAFVLSRVLFETKCSERKGQTNPPHPLCAG